MESEALDDLDWQIRTHVYDYIIEHTLPPTAAQTAQALGLTEPRVAEAYRQLDARHALILEPGGDTIRMVHPFSAIPTAFRVYANGRAYWANCAWDMLGIAVVLQSDVQIEATCPDNADLVHITVEGDAVKGHGELIHFPQPFARWYDDLISTCAAMLLFRSDADIDVWCQERQIPRGTTLTLEQTWVLSKPWYATRRNPDYRGRTAAEAQAVFAQIGLLSDFWQAPMQ